MSEFFDKYRNAKAIRTLTADEVKLGMVVRVVKVHQNDAIEAWVFRAYPPIDNADLIELLEDVPDPREELANRLCAASDNGRWTWDSITGWDRDNFRSMADEAMRWADEQRADQ